MIELYLVYLLCRPEVLNMTAPDFGYRGAACKLLQSHCVTRGSRFSACNLYDVEVQFLANKRNANACYSDRQAAAWEVPNSELGTVQAESFECPKVI